MTDTPGHTKEEIEAMSPLDKLTACHVAAPLPVQEYLDHCMNEAVPSWLARMQILMSSGPTVKVGDVQGMVEVQAAGLKHIDKVDPELGKKYSATGRDVNGILAELIDSSMRRMLLDQDTMNHEAYLDIVGGFATLGRGLNALADLSGLPAEGEGNDVAGTAS